LKLSKPRKSFGLLCAWSIKGVQNFFQKKWILKNVFSLWLNVTFKVQKVDFKAFKTELSLMVDLTIKMRP
jgi:hypothetical protein